MRILRITLKNLHSLRLNATIDFTQQPLSDAGLFAIVGDTGAGKSTILDAITLALYGKVPRNTEDYKSVMSHGASESLAEVAFEIGNESYLAKWSMHRAKKMADGKLQEAARELAVWDPEAKVYKSIASGVREMEGAVKKITGLDFDRFRRSVLLAQGDFAAFLDAKPADRSDLLERITGTELYTRISIAAFQRAKMEIEALDALKQKMSMLNLLSPEEVEAIHLELKLLEANAKELATKSQILGEQISIWDNYTQAKENLQLITEKEENLQEAKLAAAQDLERLDLHGRVVAWSADFNALSNHSQTLEGLNLQRDSEIASKEQVQQKIIALESGKNLLEESLQVKQAAYHARQEVWKEAIQLDLRMEERKKPLTEAIELSAAAVKLFQQAEVSVQEREKANERLEREWETLRAWQETHGHWSGIADSYMFLDSECRSFLKLHHDLEEENREMAVSEKAYQDAVSVLQTAEQQYEAFQKQLLDLENRFSASIPEKYPHDRNALMRLLAEEINNLSDKRSTLETYSHLDQEYRRLLSERNRHLAELESLRAQDSHLNKLLISLLETTDQLEAEAKIREEIYAQQQMIANYELDRANLQDGRPCPLCFSTEHPFRHKHVEKFIDRARKDLEQSKSALDSARKEQLSLLKQHIALGTSIESLELKLSEEGPLQVIERQMADFRGFPVQAEAIVNEKTKLATKLEELRRRNEILLDLHEELQKAETNAKAGLANVQQASVILQLERERRNHIEQSLSQNSAKIQEKTTLLKENLERFGMEFSPMRIQETLSQLASNRASYTSNERRLLDLGTQRTQERSALELEKQLFEDKKEKAESARLQADALQKDFNLLLEARKRLIGDEDPVAEEGTMRSDIEATQESFKALKDELEILQQDKKGVEGAIQTLEKSATENEERVNALTDFLTSKGIEIGFPDLTTFKNALLDPQEVVSIQNTIQEINKKASELQGQKKEVAKIIEKLQDQVSEWPSREALDHQFQECKFMHTDNHQKIGSIKQKLLEQKERAVQAAELEAQLTARQKDVRRWGALNDLIGNADGKKFRVFAQGLTLAQLVYKANQHLDKLSGRYVILKKESEDLELEIMDTFQANNVRNMKTLSGGERFLVSLALALGLADLAGGKTSIQSLFIDEGFGALDENTLESALITLENLQSAGKMIGVISHVKEMKERIPVQIQVMKKSSGNSEIQLVVK